LGGRLFICFCAKLKFGRTEAIIQERAKAGICSNIPQLSMSSLFFVELMFSPENIFTSSLATWYICGWHSSVKFIKDTEVSSINPEEG
jgi:hypothetical protein